MKNFSASFVTILVIAMLSSCDEQTFGPRFDFSGAPAAYDTTGKSRVVIEPGFYYYEIQDGFASAATAMDAVQLHYTYRRADNGTVLSSTYLNKSISPIYLHLAKQASIRAFSPTGENEFLGLRRGVPGMRGGSKRTIVVPSEFGIGYDGPGILDVELVTIVQ